MGPNERLERSQWDFFWIPDDAEVTDRPEVAAVRCDRAIPHLNIVTRTRVEPDRIPTVVEDMWEWIGHDMARWLVPDTFDRAPLEHALGMAGWHPRGRYEARAIRPRDYARTPPAGLEVRRVETLETLRDNIRVSSLAFGRDLPYTDEQLAADLAQCGDPRGRVHRYVVYRDGEPVCSGGFNWYPELRFAFLWAGGTVPEARGVGAYTALVHERVKGAAAVGAEWVGLYAKDDTSAPIVAKQGFERVGEMSYWGPGESDD